MFQDAKAHNRPILCFLRVYFLYQAHTCQYICVSTKFLAMMMNMRSSQDEQ